MNIDEQGNPEGGFSKVKLPYPSPNHGRETYAEYRARVDKLKEQGFHLGDLGDSDWQSYCMGSGQYDDFDANTTIK
jgi:hypothetical protein